MKNITAFLMNQNRQFEDVIRGLTDARDSLDGARYNLKTLSLIGSQVARLTGYEIMISSLRWMSLPLVPIGVSLL
jgi:mediator of RNA polymerase II transcription subunit 14